MLWIAASPPSGPREVEAEQRHSILASLATGVATGIRGTILDKGWLPATYVQLIWRTFNC